MLGPLVDSCFCFLSTQQMSREVTHVFEIKKKMRENEALKIEFAFQLRSKSGVQSEVQSEVQKVVQSYCLGWHFQTVGKRFFYNIWTQEGQKYHII